MTKQYILFLSLFIAFAAYSCSEDNEDINPGDERPNSYLTADIDGENYVVDELMLTFVDDNADFASILQMKDMGSASKSMSVTINVLDESPANYSLDITLTMDGAIYSVMANDNLKLEVTTDDRDEKKMIGTFQADLNSTANENTVQIRNGIFNAFYD